jgi:hypothetical protein
MSQIWLEVRIYTCGYVMMNSLYDLVLQHACMNVHSEIFIYACDFSYNFLEAGPADVGNLGAGFTELAAICNVRKTCATDFKLAVS